MVRPARGWRIMEPVRLWYDPPLRSSRSAHKLPGSTPGGPTHTGLWRNGRRTSIGRWPKGTNWLFHSIVANSSGYSSVWPERVPWAHEIAGSNPATPTGCSGASSRTWAPPVSPKGKILETWPLEVEVSVVGHRPRKPGAPQNAEVRLLQFPQTTTQSGRMVRRQIPRDPARSPAEVPVE